MYNKIYTHTAARKLIGFLALVTFFCGFHLNLSAQMLNEDSLKANYLIGFVDFIHWDRENKDPIVIGLVGDSNLEREIQLLAAKKKASGSSRGFEVVIIQNDHPDLSSIDVIFLPEGSENSWDTIIPQARDLGILTVGDSEGFLDAGGLIEFVIRKNRLRFTLNLEASEQYRIGLSSKLARLAVDN